MTSTNNTIYRITELMLQHENHILSVDQLFEDEKIGDYVKSIQIDSPYQQLLLEGVLTESIQDGKLFVSFTVEGYFHFVLGEVLFEISKNENHIFLFYILQRNNMNGIKEGVEQCLIKEVNHGKLNRLVAMIDDIEIEEEVTYYPLAHAFIKNKVEDVFKVLLEKS